MRAGGIDTEGEIPAGYWEEVSQEELSWQDGPIRAEGELAQAKVER